MKLAEALLLRKELNEKVARLGPINKEGLFEVKAKRVKVTDSVDDVTASVPRISMTQATHAYDWHAKALREVDAAIQQANWTTEVTVRPDIVTGYVDPYVKEDTE